MSGSDALAAETFERNLSYMERNVSRRLAVRAAIIAAALESAIEIVRERANESPIGAQTYADLRAADEVVWSLAASSPSFFQGAFQIRELHRALDEIETWLASFAAERPRSLPERTRRLPDWLHAFLSSLGPRCSRAERMSIEVADLLRRLEDRLAVLLEGSERITTALRYSRIAKDATGPPIERFVRSQPQLPQAPPLPRVALLTDAIAVVAA